MTLAKYTVQSTTLSFPYTDYLGTPSGELFTATMPVYYPIGLITGEPLPPGQTFPMVVYMQ